MQVDLTDSTILHVQACSASTNVTESQEEVERVIRSVIYQVKRKTVVQQRQIRKAVTREGGCSPGGLITVGHMSTNHTSGFHSH